MSACVEVAEAPGLMAMRNSTAPETELHVPAPAWRDFIAGVRAGEFDGR